MKRISSALTKGVVFVLIALMVFGLSACGGAKKDMKSELPGEWFVWHWYYVEGDNGFYDNAVFYTFTDDGKLTIKENTDDAEAIEASFVWENENTIIVSYPNGTSETFEIAPHKHDGREELTYTNVDTGLILSLENMADWTDD